jgi:DNA repair exonuclease SbcCD ATPase subunit
MRKSGITISKGSLDYILHNLRVKSTKNSIFDKNQNIYMNDYKTAFKIYKDELNKRIKAYTQRTGKKLQKHTITHLTAIVNLDTHNCNEIYMQKLIKYLEKKLGTKVFNWAVHRDEGWTDENGQKHINYHAHIEFLGLDENGNSIRRKLDKKMLRELQTEVAQVLDMQRGIYYDKNTKRKRLSTYLYKEHAKLAYAQVKKYKNAVYQLIDFAQQNFNFKINDESDLNAFLRKISNQKKAIDLLKQHDINSIEDLQNFLQNTQNKSLFSDFFNNLKLKSELNQLKQENKQLKAELAKVKDLKEINKQLREELKRAGAERAQYAQLEAYVKELKSEIKAKNLTISELKTKLNKKEKELLAQLQCNSDLKQKNAELEQLLKQKDEEIAQLKQQLQELKNMRYIERKQNADKIENLKDEIKSKSAEQAKLEQLLQQRDEILQKIEHKKQNSDDDDWLLSDEDRFYDEFKKIKQLDEQIAQLKEKMQEQQQNTQHTQKLKVTSEHKQHAKKRKTRSYKL